MAFLIPLRPTRVTFTLVFPFFDFPALELCMVPSLIFPPGLEARATIGVSFSGGKDSVATALALRDAGFHCRALFFDMLPGSDFTRRVIDQYSCLFDEPIEVRAHPHFSIALNTGVFETPMTRKDVEVERFAEYDFDDAEHDFLPDHWWAIGVRGADSPARAMGLRQTGGVIEKTKHFWPIGHWRIADVREIMQRHGVKLLPDYDLFKRSFDGFEARYTARMSAHDRRLMDTLFPHWRADCARRIYAHKKEIE